MVVKPKATWTLRSTIDALSLFVSFAGSVSQKRNGFVFVAVILLVRRQLLAPVGDASLIDASFTKATSIEATRGGNGPSAQQNATRVVDMEIPFHQFPNFPQNDQGLHPLEFVHIPKTGGTSIEMAGKLCFQTQASMYVLCNPSTHTSRALF